MSASLCICGKPECVVPSGRCHCGCGRQTRIANRGNRSHGYIAGLPRPYVRGHRRPVLHAPVIAMPFRIDGVYCRVIPLTRGYWAIVDAVDYPRLAVHKWQAMNLDGRIVAGRSISSPHKTVRYMHHEVLAPTPGFETDHANRIAIDNRRANLRYATRQQNARNRGTGARNTSGFKGVSLHRQTGKWRATIRVNGNLISLGLFAASEDAARAYNSAALQHFGEFACLNFTPQPIQF